jgi:hypothetical protein
MLFNTENYTGYKSVWAVLRLLRCLNINMAEHRSNSEFLPSHIQAYIIHLERKLDLLNKLP